jgi:hypothetical protein
LLLLLEGRVLLVLLTGVRWLAAVLLLQNEEEGEAKSAFVGEEARLRAGSGQTKLKGKGA